MSDARAHRLYEVWAYLSLHPHATIRQMVHHFGWAPATVHDAVDGLTKLGYIEPAKRRHAGRRMLVTATYTQEVAA